VKNYKVTTPVQEKWILADNQWWFLPNKPDKPEKPNKPE
jgi:hypothetical protein